MVAALSLRKRLLAPVLSLLVALAGCIGGDGDPVDNPAFLNDTEDNRTAPNATLPDDRGESSGLKEVNKTEEGLGGREHRHDYWKGATEKVVFDDRVWFYPTPVYPDGEGSSARSVAYVKLPQPNLVFEGTDRVEILVSDPQVAVDGGLDPAVGDLPPRVDAPAVQVQYRSAADSDWRDPQGLPYDSALDIKVSPREADMPHSVSSLWVLRLTSDHPDQFSIGLQVKIHKGREVVDWPGHPDFYADKPWRKVLDADVSTHMVGAQEGILYDSAGTWVHPERLVSHGTTRLEIFINVTSFSASTGQDYEYIFLETHNATIIGPEIAFGDRWRDPDWSEDRVSWNFTVPVDEWGMDGPYQPASRWGFRALATFAQVGVPDGPSVGLCPGCFPYDIGYHLTIIAVSDPLEAGDGD